MKRARRIKLVLTCILIWVLVLGSTAAVNASPEKNTAENSSGITSLFSDVRADDINAVYINYLAEQGITKGFPDGTYHPAEGLTRAQAAAIIVRATGLAGDSSQVRFNDVAANHWAAKDIAAAADAGYIKGFPDGSFRPEEPLNRAQGISLVIRLSRSADSGAELPELQDMDKNHWAARAAAEGLASGMVTLNPDGTKYLPDEDFNRGDLARALGVLLTSAPDLNQANLNGQITVLKGEVKIGTESQKSSKIIKNSSVIKPGDVIITGRNGEAELTFPDGTGMLLKPDTELTVKETRGRTYIKTDGSQGIAVDWLLLDLKKGRIFGALATKYNGENENKEEAAAGKSNTLLASTDESFGLLAANESTQNLPWYQTAEKKKVKVEVDMPWGVAAIRGSFWNNWALSQGCGMSLLHGNGSYKSGGKEQVLKPLQSTGNSSKGEAPKPPQTMTETEAKQWQQENSWIQNRIQKILNNQPADEPQDSGDEPGDNQDEQPPSLPEIIDNALEQAGENTSEEQGTPPQDNKKPGSGGGSSQPTGVIKGKVINGNLGVGINNAAVTVYKGEEAVASALTDAEGSYTISNISSGKYTVGAAADNCKPESICDVEVTEGTVTADVNFILQQTENVVVFAGLEQNVLEPIGAHTGLSILFNAQDADNETYYDTRIYADKDVEFDLYSRASGSNEWGEPVALTLAAETDTSYTELTAGTGEVIYPLLRDKQNTEYVAVIQTVAGIPAQEYKGEVHVTIIGIMGDLYNDYAGADVAAGADNLIGFLPEIVEVIHHQDTDTLEITLNQYVVNSYIDTEDQENGGYLTPVVTLSNGKTYKIGVWDNEGDGGSICLADINTDGSTAVITAHGIEPGVQYKIKLYTDSINNPDVIAESEWKYWIVADSISGTISLPDGKAAPEGGLTVNVNAFTEDTDNWAGIEVVIPQGDNSVDYILPVVPACCYKVKYYIETYDYPASDYVRMGYYSQSGTTTRYHGSTYVDGRCSPSDINLDILTGNTISGTVSLPNEEVAPKDIELYVKADSDQTDDFAETSVTIPAGCISAAYSLAAIPADGYVIRYSLKDWDASGNGYINKGYYNAAGTTIDRENVNEVNIANGNQKEINLTVLKGNTISGTISLPNGAAASEDIDVIIAASKSPLYYELYQQVTIPAGSSSAEYCLAAEAAEYCIEYEICDWEYRDIEYIHKGYYGPNGTNHSEDYAAPVDISNSNKSNINLTILPGSTISGTISLPDGYDSSAGCIDIVLCAETGDELGSYYCYQNARIHKGNTSTSYSITVPPDNNYYLSYLIPDNEDETFSGLATEGYYSENGTVAFYQDVTPIDAVSDIDNIDLQIKEIWETVGNPGFASAADESEISLFVDESGCPYVAYINEDNEVEVKGYANGQWDDIGSGIMTSGNKVNLTGELTGSFPNLYLAYKDTNNMAIVAESVYAQNNWTQLGVTGLPAGRCFSLALSYDNVPYLAYDYNGGNSDVGGVVSRYVYSGNEWQVQGGKFSNSPVTDTSLCVYDENILLAYLTDDAEVIVTAFYDGIWETYGSPLAAADNSSVVMLGEFLVYQDSDCRIMAAEFNDNEWSSEPISESGANSVVCRLFMGELPFMAYKDSNGNIIIKYYNNGWEKLSGPGIASGNGLDMEISFSDSNQLYVYIAYKDSSGNVTVKKYEIVPE